MNPHKGLVQEVEISWRKLVRSSSTRARYLVSPVSFRSLWASRVKMTSPVWQNKSQKRKKKAIHQFRVRQKGKGSGSGSIMYQALWSWASSQARLGSSLISVASITHQKERGREAKPELLNNLPRVSSKNNNTTNAYAPENLKKRKENTRFSRLLSGASLLLLTWG